MRVISPIISSEQVAPHAHRIRLHAPELVTLMKPGQFVNVVVNKDIESHDPLLRRPISIADYDIDKGTFDLVFNIVGRGTAILAENSIGSSLDVMGPIGNSFPIDTNVKHRSLLIAGGIGIPPLFPLAKQLISLGGEVSLRYGARQKEQLLMVQEYVDLGIDCTLYTDDGSLGQKGYVTEGLIELLNKERFDCIYACGPQPLLVKLQSIALETGITSYLSLERHMACGVGACLGCTVLLNDRGQTRYALLCQEGPVFEAKEVLFHE